MCKLSHFIYKCPTYLPLSISYSINRVTELNIRKNYVSLHLGKQCTSHNNTVTLITTLNKITINTTYFRVLQWFYLLQKRINSNSNFKSEYIKFIREYCELHHM